MIPVKNILLAEDDEDDISIFRDTFKTLDFSVKIQVINDGVALMEILQAYLPDLLFLDLHMPYKNGLECLAEMKNKPMLENLPKVVFSSTNRIGNIQAAYENGAHLFITKTGSYSEYLLKLKAIIGLNWNDPQEIKARYYYKEDTLTLANKTPINW